MFGTFRTTTGGVSVAAAALLTTLTLGVSPAAAQTAAPPAAAPAATTAAPDVQVVAFPLPTGEWAVSAVYARKVPRAEAVARHNEFLKLSGWKANAVQWEDKALGLARRDGRPIRRGSAADADAPNETPVMTSVSFQTPAGVVDLVDGTVDIAPWIRAYRDQGRLNLTFVLPQGVAFRYRGLRYVDGPDVTVALTGAPPPNATSAAPGALTYAVAVKNPALSAVNLPRYQAAGESAQSLTRRAEAKERSAAALRSRSRALGAGLVALFALGAGVLVYLWATRLTGRP